MTSFFKRSRPSIVLEGEEGLTIIELVVALTIIAMSFLSLSFVLYGGMNALASARLRTSFTEIANAEIERLRALPYDQVAVVTATAPHYNDPQPGMFQGRDAVISSTATVTSISNITSTVRGLPSYTVRRWVTWTDVTGTTFTTAGLAPRQLKRITVGIDWKDKETVPRSLRLSSLLYPGEIGRPPPGGFTNAEPVATLTVSPATGISSASASPSSGTNFTFNASSSVDPDGVITQYRWTFGDGTTQTTAASTVSKVYSTPKRYQAFVIVVDDQGAFDDSSIVEILVT